MYIAGTYVYNNTREQIKKDAPDQASGNLCFGNVGFTRARLCSHTRETFPLCKAEAE